MSNVAETGDDVADPQLAVHDQNRQSISTTIIEIVEERR